MGLEVFQSEVITLCSKVSHAHLIWPPGNGTISSILPVSHENEAKCQRFRGKERCTRFTFDFKEKTLTLYILFN